LFNEVVREQITQMKVGERCEKITEAFNSIRDDAKSMVDQLEDGKITTMKKLQNAWVRVTRGDIPDRFRKIKETYLEVTGDTKDQIEREEKILESYMDFRDALKEAQVTAFQLLKKPRRPCRPAKGVWRWPTRPSRPTPAGTASRSPGWSWPGRPAEADRDEKGRPYREDALDDTLSNLYREAKTTSRPDDDVRFSRIRDLMEEEQSMSAEIENLQSKLRRQQKSFQDVEELRRRFRRSDYDSGHSYFPGGLELGALLALLMSGRAAGGEVWGRIGREQGFRLPRHRPEPGGGNVFPGGFGGVGIALTELTEPCYWKKFMFGAEVNSGGVSKNALNASWI
jgi:hypothetical protein